MCYNYVLHEQKFPLICAIERPRVRGVVTLTNLGDHMNSAEIPDASHSPSIFTFLRRNRWRYVPREDGTEPFNQVAAKEQLVCDKSLRYMRSRMTRLYFNTAILLHAGIA